MAKIFQFRRYSASQLAVIIPADGEIIINEDTHGIVVGDGATAGGFPVVGTGGGAGNIVQSAVPLNVTTPANAGQFCYATSNNTLWLAKGITSADWVQI